MLGWLIFIVAALVGLFVVFQGQATEYDATSAPLTAAAVVAFLVTLYVATLKTLWQDKPPPATIAAITITIVAAALAAWWSGAMPYVKVQRQANDQGATVAPPASQNVSVLIRKDSSGRFVAQGQLNTVATTMLIDTGATVVMLKHSDAEKAGIDTSALSFTTPVQTANGTVYAASARIRTITIGLLRVDDIEALVTKPGSLNENLLGMSFLRRLSSYDLKGDFLTLRE